MTKLYVFRRDEPLLPEAETLLPPWRRESFSRLRNEAVRQESLAAGLLTAVVLKKHGLSEAEVSLLPMGKPVLPEGSGWFSLSHSGDYALCAVSDEPVGCDVQVMRPVKLSVARRFCDREQAWLLSQPEDMRQEALFRLWTRKEAWVKAASRDRMLGLDEYEVLSDGIWSFRDYILPGNTPAALCGKGDLPENFVLLTRRELLAGLGK